MNEDMVNGHPLLWQAFQKLPYRAAGRDTVITGLDDPMSPVVLIRSGFAYRACSFADGRRAILDVLVPGDVAGLDQVVIGHTGYEIVAAGRLSYQTLSAAAFRDLLGDRAIALSAMATMSEARLRMDRLVAMIGRLDARARLAALLLGLYERLHQRGLVNRAMFSLPLTQQQIADHLGLTLVHVNRTLRRMREEHLAHIERQTVVLLNLDGLRALVQGLPSPIRTPALTPVKEPPAVKTPVLVRAGD